MKTNAVLIFSSMLVGDADGNKSFPTAVPARGATGTTTYRLRIPGSFLGTPYKLVFVANGEAVAEQSDPDQDGHPYLYFDRPETRILGTLEPTRQGVSP